MAEYNAKGNGLLLSQMDWENETAVAALLEELVSRKRKDNMEFEASTSMNWAWYEGRQDLVLSPLRDNSPLVPLPNPDGRIERFYNQIGPLMNQLVAILASEPVNPSTLPATDDFADMLVARRQTQFLSYYHNKLRIKSLVRKNDLQTTVTGDSYIKVSWNPSIGPQIDFADYFGGALKPKEILDLDLGDGETLRSRGFKSTKNAVGDIECDVVNATNLYWGPIGSEFRHAEWVIEVSEISRDEAAGDYGMNPEELVDGIGETARVYRAADYSRIEGWRNKDRDCVPKIELWAPRSSRIPHGLHLTMIGGKLYRPDGLMAPRGPDGEKWPWYANPYWHGEVPYVPFRFGQAPDRMHGICLVSQLLSPQHDLNQRMAQCSEIMDSAGYPVYWAAEGAIVNEEEMVAVGGGIRTYNQGYERPQKEEASSIPGSMFAQISLIMRMMQDIASVHAASLGQNPSGSRSNEQNEGLRQADEQPIAALLDERRDSWEQVFRRVLALGHQYIKEPRMLRVLGHDMAWSSLTLTGKDLVGEHAGVPGVDYFEVQVDTIGLPRGRMAAVNWVNALAKGGWLDPQNADDRRLVREMLRIGKLRQNADPRIMAAEVQYEEMMALMAGQFVQPAPGELHDEHRSVLRQYIQSPRFKRHPPQVQVMFLAHDRMHLQLMAKDTATERFTAEQVIAQVAAEFGLGQTQAQQPQPPAPQMASPAVAA